jgi:hypothetical protein
MAHAIPTATATKRKRDHTAYLIRSVAVRCVTQASASEAISANINSAGKWPMGFASIGT